MAPLIKIPWLAEIKLTNDMEYCERSSKRPVLDEFEENHLSGAKATTYLLDLN